ncbi:MAG: AMP-binding protein [Sphingopyxis sp.]|nr:AMP-binding protein [Sphingopyxis sp.]
MDRARRLGLPVRQGYGLTECASVVSLQDAGDDDPSSVGRCLPHMVARIADDGEIILDGPICLGAVGGEAPASPLHTGDIGSVDSEGRLHIEGRKSNLIITSFGRNISPEWVEAALIEQPEITQAMVYGDGLPAPAALLVPSHPDADLAAAVAKANDKLPAYARIGAWREAAHFTPVNGLLTGNGRLRRDAIRSAYLDRPPLFFTELEARTVRERLRFLMVSQSQARAGTRDGSDGRSCLRPDRERQCDGLLRHGLCAGKRQRRLRDARRFGGRQESRPPTAGVHLSDLARRTRPGAYGLLCQGW